jgi:hypothetical protein
MRIGERSSRVGLLDSGQILETNYPFYGSLRSSPATTSAQVIFAFPVVSELVVLGFFFSSPSLFLRCFSIFVRRRLTSMTPCRQAAPFLQQLLELSAERLRARA